MKRKNIYSSICAVWATAIYSNCYGNYCQILYIMGFFAHSIICAIFIFPRLNKPCANSNRTSMQMLIYMSWRFTAWLGKYLPPNLNPAPSKNTFSKHWCNQTVVVQGRKLRTWETVWQTTVMQLCLTVWQFKAFISWGQRQRHCLSHIQIKMCARGSEDWGTNRAVMLNLFNTSNLPDKTRATEEKLQLLNSKLVQICKVWEYQGRERIFIQAFLSEGKSSLYQLKGDVPVDRTVTKAKHCCRL